MVYLWGGTRQGGWWGHQGRRDQERGRMGDGGTDRGPPTHLAGASAHDPARGTLAVRDGLFDSLGEQLRPGKHSRAITEAPPGLPLQPHSTPLSLHSYATGPPSSGQPSSGVPVPSPTPAPPQPGTCPANPHLTSGGLCWALRIWPRGRPARPTPSGADTAPWLWDASHRAGWKCRGSQAHHMARS